MIIVAILCCIAGGVIGVIVSPIVFELIDNIFEKRAKKKKKAQEDLNTYLNELNKGWKECSPEEKFKEAINHPEGRFRISKDE